MSETDMSDVTAEAQPPDTGLQFGAWRGRWLDQVHDDPEMTGDSFRVMYAVTRFLNSKTHSCYPGDIILAEKSHVSMRTVQRSIAKARERGHLRVSAAVGPKPRNLAPIMRDERRQQDRQEGRKQGRQEGRQAFPNPSEQSMTCAPNSRDSQNSRNPIEYTPHNTSCCGPPEGGHAPDDRLSETEDEACSPFDSRDSTETAKQSTRSGQGTRLPPDWKPSEEDVAFAESHRIPNLKREVEKFRAFYLAKPGRAGKSCDWSAQFRYWLLESVDRAKRSQPPKKQYAI